MLGRVSIKRKSTVSRIMLASRCWLDPLDNMSKEFNKRKFRAWLFAQPDDRKFDYSGGKPYDEKKCVLCAFLAEKTECDFSVGGNYIWINNREFSIPPWANFISIRDSNNKITAKDAKALFLRS
jgi:hypothetical protein